MTNEEGKEIAAVLTEYGINSEKCKIVRDTMGAINKIYFVTQGTKKFVLRKSNPITSEKHIKLEVAVLDYLQKNNFKLTPVIIPNRRGQEITKFNGHFFTLQNFLNGKVKGCWNDLSKFTLPLLDSYFGAVANFSRAVQKFSFNSKVENRPLWFYAREGKKILAEQLKVMPASVGKKLLNRHKEYLLRFIDKAKQEFMATKFDKLPKQLIHFDWHPGNILYNGNKVSAIFDLDWALFDCRLGDVATAIGQSCYFYGGKNGGKFRKDRIMRGLCYYRKKYGKSEFAVREENFLIMISLKVYMWFLLLWAIGNYNTNRSSKSLVFLKHFLNTIILNDFDELFS